VIHVSWSKPVLRFRAPTGGLDCDSQTGKIKETDQKLELMEAPGEVRQAFLFAGGKSSLCLYQIGSSSPEGEYRLELQKPGEKKRKVILTWKKNDVTYLHSPFFPSPDDKLVAVRCVESKNGKEKERILVIDASGEIVAEVEGELATKSE
jgi:hypothetical protein